MTPGSPAKPFAPYFVKTVAGVKVAVIGITTPSVPNWEKPENYGGYRFLPGVAALKKTLAELRAREQPDLVLAAVHAGLDRDPKTGVVTIDQMPGENMVYQMATEVPEIDAIVFGHTHSEMARYSHRQGAAGAAQELGDFAGPAGFPDAKSARTDTGPWRRRIAG